MALELLKQNQASKENRQAEISSKVATTSVAPAGEAESSASKNISCGSVQSSLTKRRTAGALQSSARTKGIKRAKATAPEPQDKWAILMKYRRKDLPKKYRDTPEQENRLKTVWKTVNSKPVRVVYVYVL